MDINNDIDFLKTVGYHDVPNFSFDGYHTVAKCVKVYDGDTITVVFMYHQQPYQFKIRLAGIDTPELRSNDEEEVKKAIEAREKLVELIKSNEDDLIYLKCGKFGKYGRILGTIYPYLSPEEVEMKNNVKSYNDILLESGLAKKYTF